MDWFLYNRELRHEKLEKNERNQKKRQKSEVTGMGLELTAFSSVNKCNKAFKNGPSKISGRQPLKNFTWSILEYLS